MIVLDASIVVKLLTREAGAGLAVERVAREPERIAPDWLYAEVANALSKKVRYAGLPWTLAQEGWLALPTILPDIVPSMPLAEEAMRLSVELRHAFYDCLYLALALRERALLLTADRKFFEALADQPYRRSVELLI